jgi:hypothetical protein
MTKLAAALAVLIAVGPAPVAAQSDAAKDGFKKTEKGVGELFRGMGQEIKKLTDGKKDGKKAEKKD